MSRTDEELEALEKRLSAIYSQAEKEVGKSWMEFVEQSDKEIKHLEEEYKKAIESGESKAIKRAGRDLAGAKQERTLLNKHYKAMTEQLATEISHVNETAAAYINGTLPEVYAINYTEVASDLKKQVKGYSFELVDRNTVKHLVTKKENLLPLIEIDGKKDVRWNVKKINSEVLQGIVQGESMPKIAKRLSFVLEMNEVSAIRNARTAVTGAENIGRMDMLHEAKAKGIETVKIWRAAIDSRTRHAHQALNGQERGVDEPFNSDLGDIMFPGDPDADPANVYNCRCTLTYKVKSLGGVDV